MEPISIPEEQVVPMEAIAPNVHGLRIVFVNIFGVTHAGESWTLVDAGMPFSEGLIRKWVEKNFAAPPNALVLTHGHFDHVSAARSLADSWNVPIYAHPMEAPYLTGKQEYPKPDVGAGGGIMSWLSPLYPRGPVNLGERLRFVQHSASNRSAIPEMPGWQVVFTPGHTPGHMSLFRPDDRTLIAGDAFCTTKPESFFEAAITQKPELHGPPAYFTWDWKLASESVRRLADLNPAIVAPGHGKPLSGSSLPEELHRLAQYFDELAVPGKIRKPAA